MKNWIIIFALLCAFSINAQISFRTGIVQMDRDLNTINTHASLNFDTYKSNLSVTYNTPVSKIDYMRQRLNMVPGEIYLALEIGRISRTNIDNVLTVYRRDKDKGWGHIAKELGIKPGSSEFHQLKNNVSSKKNKSKGKSKNKGKGKKKK